MGDRAHVPGHRPRGGSKDQLRAAQIRRALLWETRTPAGSWGRRAGVPASVSLRTRETGNTRMSRLCRLREAPHHSTRHDAILSVCPSPRPGYFGTAAARPAFLQDEHRAKLSERTARARGRASLPHGHPGRSLCSRSLIAHTGWWPEPCGKAALICKSCKHAALPSTCSLPAPGPQIHRISPGRALFKEISESYFGRWRFDSNSLGFRSNPQTILS